jgi:hypothetical protein
MCCVELDAPVFAVRLTSSDSWEVLALAVRELSGRHGIRRIARVSERSFRQQRLLLQRDSPLLRSLRVRRVRRASPLGSKLAG